MFGAQSDPSRTERATPKRRKKQRSEGNVPKAPEVSKTMSLVAGSLALFMWIRSMAEEMKGTFIYFFSHAADITMDQAMVTVLGMDLMKRLAYILLPVLLVLAFVGYMTIRLQVGKLWTTKVFKFRWSRFNLFKGLKQMLFSPQALVRLIKSVLIAAVVSIVPITIIRREYENFLPMYYATTEGVARYMLETGFYMVLYTLVPMAAIAAFDLWHSRFTYEENLKMTKQEVKDERKQAEGDPVIKQKQRQKMLTEMAKRMLQSVPRADVVVTNPTHIAVALLYDADEAPAPVVLAKGAGKLAERIKEVAREHRVPIRENVPLARALYKSVEVGETIPEELYKATAAILAAVWRMKGKLVKK